MAKSGKYKQIHLNRSLKTVTEGKVGSRMRPDISAVAKEGGKIDMIEVPSPKQTVGNMRDKIKSMKKLLGDMTGPGSDVIQMQ